MGARSIHTPETTTTGQRHSPTWTLLALVLFALGIAFQYGPVLGEAPDQLVPWNPEPVLYPWDEIPDTWPDWRFAILADMTQGIYRTAHNAKAIVRDPTSVFEAEICAPSNRSLTSGIPMITMGILGIPAYLANGNAVLIYNTALVLLTFLSAWAMFVLVRDWTGVPAAGIVAGLLMGWSPVRMAHTFHASEFDYTWTLFALFFARRLLAHGRWRDTVGLALSYALQIAASFYALMAVAVLVPPLLVWMLRSYGVRQIRTGQWAMLLFAGVLVPVFLLGPFLEARELGALSDRTAQAFEPLTGYLPSGDKFPGVVALALALVALIAGRWGLSPKLLGDPRGFLVVSALLLMLGITGPTLGETFGTPLPDLYGAAASLVPGMKQVRAISQLSEGVYLAVVVLAGMGTAALVRRAGRAGFAIAAALIAVTILDLARPSFFGMERRYRWETFQIPYPTELLTFYEGLERDGNHGPIFEIFDPWQPYLTLDPYYHGRRTSACYGSFIPDITNELYLVGNQLPNPAAIDTLASHGFTTIVVRHRYGFGETYRKRFRKDQGESTSYLRPVGSNAHRTAFEIVPGTTP